MYDVPSSGNTNANNIQAVVEFGSVAGISISDLFTFETNTDIPKQNVSAIGTVAAACFMRAMLTLLLFQLAHSSSNRSIRSMESPRWMLNMSLPQRREPTPNSGRFSHRGLFPVVNACVPFLCHIYVGLSKVGCMICQHWLPSVSKRASRFPLSTA